MIVVNCASVAPAAIGHLRALVDNASALVMDALLSNINATLTSTARACAVGVDARDAVSALQGALVGIQSALHPKHIVLCAVLPPEGAGVFAPYPALFVDGWDNAFVDCARDGCISAASWMSVMLGKRGGFDEADAQALRSHNPAVLLAVTARLEGMRFGRHFAGGPQTDEDADAVALEPFYVQPGHGQITPADRVRALERLEVVMHSETLASLMAHDFLALFSNADIIRQLQVRSRCVCCSA